MLVQGLGDTTRHPGQAALIDDLRNELAAPQAIADAFIASRTNAFCGRIYGRLAAAIGQQEILGRAWPE